MAFLATLQRNVVFPERGSPKTPYIIENHPFKELFHVKHFFRKAVTGKRSAAFYEKGLHQKQRNRRRYDHSYISGEEGKKGRCKERKQGFYHLDHRPIHPRSIQKATKPVKTYTIAKTKADHEYIIGYISPILSITVLLYNKVNILSTIYSPPES